MYSEKYSECLFFTAASFARTMTRIAEEEFSPAGLTPSYGFLLMSIADSAGIQPSLLAQEVDLAASTVTRLLDKLEAKGLVHRRVKGKTIRIHLTPRARKLMPLVRKSWAALTRRASTRLGEKSIRELGARIRGADLELRGR